MKSSILIIYTGGTIGMKNDAETGALVPFDFSGIYDEFPSLKRLNVDIDVLTMDPVIDSSNVTPANWAALAELIRDNYTRYDGFVVLHGTDTMSYTASALTAAKTSSRPSRSRGRTSADAPRYPKCRSISRTGCSAPTVPPNAAPRR